MCIKYEFCIFDSSNKGKYVKICYKKSVEDEKKSCVHLARLTHASAYQCIVHSAHSNRTQLLMKGNIKINETERRVRKREETE